MRLQSGTRRARRAGRAGARLDPGVASAVPAGALRRRNTTVGGPRGRSAARSPIGGARRAGALRAPDRGRLARAVALRDAEPRRQPQPGALGGPEERPPAGGDDRGGGRAGTGDRGGGSRRRRGPGGRRRRGRSARLKGCRPRAAEALAEAGGAAGRTGRGTLEEQPAADGEEPRPFRGAAGGRWGEAEGFRGGDRRPAGRGSGLPGGRPAVPAGLPSVSQPRVNARATSLPGASMPGRSGARGGR